MTAVTRRFDDERGNAIYLHVSAPAGQEEVLIDLRGPTSKTENIITRKEAVELHGALSEVLGLQKAGDSCMSKLADRESVLVDAVHCFHWMARRYADMRSSYAPSMFNGHVRKLRALGFGLKHPLFARDGMGRRYDGLTEEEVADAAQDMPRGFHPDPNPLLEALRDIADMPERGGCDDEITAVELWRLMQKRAREAVAAVEDDPTEERAP